MTDPAYGTFIPETDDLPEGIAVCPDCHASIHASHCDTCMSHGYVDDQTAMRFGNDPRDGEWL